MKITLCGKDRFGFGGIGFEILEETIILDLPKKPYYKYEFRKGFKILREFRWIVIQSNSGKYSPAMQFLWEW